MYNLYSKTQGFMCFSTQKMKLLLFGNVTNWSLILSVFLRFKIFFNVTER